MFLSEAIYPALALCKLLSIIFIELFDEIYITLSADMIMNTCSLALSRRTHPCWYLELA